MTGLADKFKTVVMVVSALDYGAMAGYFEEMALKGWMLEKAGFFTLRFRKTEPKRRIFFVDVFPFRGVFESTESRKTRDYRELCEETGWHYVTAVNGWQIFWAEKGDNPVPIQTDALTESAILRRHFRRIITSQSVSFLCLLYMMYVQIRNFNEQTLYSNCGVSSLLLVPAIIVFILFLFGHALRCFIRIRRNLKNGKPAPYPTMRSVRTRSRMMIWIPSLLFFLGFAAVLSDADTIGFMIPLIFFLLPFLIYALVFFSWKFIFSGDHSRLRNVVCYAAVSLAILVTTLFSLYMVVTSRRPRPCTQCPLPAGKIVVRLSDLNGKWQLESEDYYASSSILVPANYTYGEYRYGCFVSTHIIRAVSSGLASYIMRSMIKQKEKSIFPAGLLAQHPELRTPPPRKTAAADWGADEAYYTNSNAELLLRRGNTVYELGCSLEFTRPDVAAAFKRKLGL